jgi:hemerythrin-like metal-binding protein
MPLQERRKYKYFRILFVDCRDIVTWLTQKGLEVLGKREPLTEEPIPVETPTVEPLSVEFLSAETARDTLRAKAGPLPPIATGVPLIDQQHSDLLATIQSLGKAVQENQDTEAVVKTVGFLEVYTDEHFRYEEAYLERLQFPGLEEHRREHTYFRMQVDQLRHRLSTGDTTITLELSHLLFRWLQDHILKEDLAYTEFVRDRKATYKKTRRPMNP